MSPSGKKCSLSAGVSTPVTVVKPVKPSASVHPQPAPTASAPPPPSPAVAAVARGNKQSAAVTPASHLSKVIITHHRLHSCGFSLHRPVVLAYIV